MVFHCMNNNKKILITGATSGVGYAITKELLIQGYEVWATGRNGEVLTELKTLGAMTIQADLSNKDALNQVLLAVDTPDIVIFSAGVGTFAYTYEATDEEVARTMDVNVLVPMQLTRRLLPRMMAKNNGQLIYIGSQAGKVATLKASVYAASKHALIGYTNALRLELNNFNIDVTTIHPGPIDTPFLDLADQTGDYRTSVHRHLLPVDTVVKAICRAIQKPVREINLPWYMGITSKIYAVMPKLTERIGHKFFFKKE